MAMSVAHRPAARLGVFSFTLRDNCACASAVWGHSSASCSYGVLADMGLSWLELWIGASKRGIYSLPWHSRSCFADSSNVGVIVLLAFWGCCKDCVWNTAQKPFAWFLLCGFLLVYRLLVERVLETRCT